MSHQDIPLFTSPIPLLGDLTTPEPEPKARRDRRGPVGFRPTALRRDCCDCLHWQGVAIREGATFLPRRLPASYVQYHADGHATYHCSHHRHDPSWRGTTK